MMRVVGQCLRGFLAVMLGGLNDTQGHRRGASSALYGSFLGWHVKKPFGGAV
jgi:hypothetical protein